MKEIREFTIDRRIWLRGEGPEPSRLIRPEDGKKCCLGIYLEACGLPASLLLNSRTPADGKLDKLDRPSWLVYESSFASSTAVQHSQDCASLMEINDAPIAFLPGAREGKPVSEEDRERLVAKGFAEHGIQVNFIG